MEWSKLKNIILLILLLVNLFLLIMVSYQEIYTQQTETAVREDAVGILERNGIAVSMNVVPWDVTLPALEVTRDEDAEAAIAQRVLGKNVQTKQGTSTEYQNDHGSMTFFSTGGFSLELTGLSETNGGRIEEHGKAFLRKLDMDCVVLETRQQGTVTELILCQQWKKKSIFNCQVQMHYEEGVLRTVEGRRLAGKPTKGTGNEVSLPAATLLVDFMGAMLKLDVPCTQILAMEPGYVCPPGLVTKVTLTPAWLIETDKGTYQLNGLTGQLEKAVA